MTFLRRKLLHFLLTVLIVSAITFAMIDLLPGDAAIVFTGPEASVETVAAIRHEMGLDAPAVVRYFRWIGRAASGDLGLSMVTREPVWDALVERLPVTLELLLFAQLMALSLAIPTAMICAGKPGGTIDRILTTLGFASLSIPNFVMAILLVFFSFCASGGCRQPALRRFQTGWRRTCEACCFRALASRWWSGSFSFGSFAVI